MRDKLSLPLWNAGFQDFKLENDPNFHNLVFHFLIGFTQKPKKIYFNELFLHLKLLLVRERRARKEFELPTKRQSMFCFFFFSFCSWVYVFVFLGIEGLLGIEQRTLWISFLIFIISKRQLYHKVVISGSEHFGSKYVLIRISFSLFFFEFTGISLFWFSFYMIFKN